ncbi:unnamed protein product [Allacma fusca]|uniref:Uncharacterized protein n=1 Tax=Allacma fusca TaxID=39272 RepID=A0A8J2JGS4_9HEXA|nr:unnamed protein product [Allacma fusca]
MTARTALSRYLDKSVETPLEDLSNDDPDFQQSTRSVWTTITTTSLSGIVPSTGVERTDVTSSPWEASE